MTENQCARCRKNFRAPAELARHTGRRRQCGIRDIAPEDINNPNRCKYCNRVYKQSSHHTRHVEKCRFNPASPKYVALEAKPAVNSPNVGPSTEIMHTDTTPVNTTNITGGSLEPNYKELYFSVNREVVEARQKIAELTEIIRELRTIEDKVRNCNEEKTKLESSRTSLLKNAALL